MSVNHRTGYEEASGLMEIQWQPGISPSKDRLGKKRGVWGLPSALLPTFPAPEK